MRAIAVLARCRVDAQRQAERVNSRVQLGCQAAARATDRGGLSTLDPSGSDPGKKAVGRNRHILTDALGLLLSVVIHPASIQDRGGAEPLLAQARRQFPFFERVIGDAGYQRPKMLAAVQRAGPRAVAIVRQCDKQRFVVLSVAIGPLT